MNADEREWETKNLSALSCVYLRPKMGFSASCQWIASRASLAVCRTKFAIAWTGQHSGKRPQDRKAENHQRNRSCTTSIFAWRPGEEDELSLRNVR